MRKFVILLVMSLLLVGCSSSSPNKGRIFRDVFDQTDLQWTE